MRTYTRQDYSTLEESKIEKEKVNRLFNEPEDYKFWERDRYTVQRNKNKLPILRSKTVYTIG